MARLTLRVDFGPGRAIGHGKIRLLEAVRDYGSISAAGAFDGNVVSSRVAAYRRAEPIFEEPVIDAKHGGSGAVAPN